MRSYLPKYHLFVNPYIQWEYRQGHDYYVDIITYIQPAKSSHNFLSCFVKGKEE